MVTQTRITKKRPDKNGSAKPNGTNGYETRSHWPVDIEDAYRRDLGPYTAANTWVLLDEEPLELFNGWLVWQEMTGLEERQIANKIQVILDLAARWLNFGEVYPDQAECKMQNGDVLKPDVCVISKERRAERGKPVAEGIDHLVLKGSPELVVEIRSPSNRRTQERRKRWKYFKNEAVVIWDVDPRQRKIWVYEVENPEKGQEFTEEDDIICERLLPGWKRRVGDFFSGFLTAEEMIGQAAVQWRAESEAKGKLEGELGALRSVVMRQARRKFGEGNLPADLSLRLGQFSAAQLNELVDSVADSATLEVWLGSFPAR